MDEIGILCKIQVGDCIPILSPVWQLHPCLTKTIQQEFIPNSTYFTNGTMVINNKSSCSWHIDETGNIKTTPKQKHIPFVCDDSVIWKSVDSFHQNNMKISGAIYQQVKSQLVSSIIDSDNYPDTLIAIGGDLTTYLVNYWNRYSSYPQFSKKLIGISNSADIIDDVRYNFETIGLKSINLHLVNYSRFGDIILPLADATKTILIIHLARIHISILEWILKQNIGNIKGLIFIYCHHNDFKKKVKLLEERFIKVEEVCYPNGDSEPVCVVRFTSIPAC